MLSPNWSSREEYAYGWFVPFFAIYLFLRRWPDRWLVAPEAAANLKGSVWQNGVIGLIALALLPMRIILEINADWPSISWSYTALVIGLSVHALARVGGWPWVKHFGFAVSFIVVALPWPYGIERGLIQNLMRIVAELTVELFGFFGIPALQHGNLIEVGSGMVGVNEACSGIRSFQSTLMAGLLMGEMYRLKLSARVFLTFTGLALAFAFNVVRTSILTWQVHRNGAKALEKWHDPAGLMIAAACFATLWAMAAWAQKRWTHDSSSPNRRGSVIDDFRPCFGYMRIIGVWVVFVLVFTEAWYRAHATQAAGFFRWTVRLPVSDPTFKTVEIPPRATELLSYDSALAGTWAEPDATEWNVFFFRWEPKSIQSIFSARIHRPDICLPGAGLTEKTNAGIAHVTAGSLTLPFTCYTFASTVDSFHVFFCQWEDGLERQSGLAGSRKFGRIRTAFEGKRRMGQQSLEFILKGYTDLLQAENALRKRLPAFIEEHSLDLRSASTLSPSANR